MSSLVVGERFGVDVVVVVVVVDVDDVVIT